MFDAGSRYRHFSWMIKVCDTGDCLLFKLFFLYVLMFSNFMNGSFDELSSPGYHY